MHYLDFVEKAFQLTLNTRHICICIRIESPSSKPRSTLGNNLTLMLHHTTTDPKDVEGKAMNGESKRATKWNECFKCCTFGHFAYKYPVGNLLVDEVHNEGLDEYGIEEKINAP